MSMNVQDFGLSARACDRCYGQKLRCRRQKFADTCERCARAGALCTPRPVRPRRRARTNGNEQASVAPTTPQEGRSIDTSSSAIANSVKSIPPSTRPILISRISPSRPPVLTLPLPTWALVLAHHVSPLVQVFSANEVSKAIPTLVLCRDRTLIRAFPSSRHVLNTQHKIGRPSSSEPINVPCLSHGSHQRHHLHQPFYLSSRHSPAIPTLVCHCLWIRRCLLLNSTGGQDEIWTLPRMEGLLRGMAPGIIQVKSKLGRKVKRTLLKAHKSDLLRDLGSASSRIST
jgi:hypothetical protein